MIIKRKKLNGLHTIELAGRINGEAPQFRNMCNKLINVTVSTEPDVVLDFRRVLWINVYAIGLLLHCLKVFIDNSGDIHLVALSPAVLAYFRRAKLDTVFPIYENLSDVVDDLQILQTSY